MATNKIIGELINKHALAHNIRPDIVACVVLQESNGDTFAWRWEEAFYYDRLEHVKREGLSGWVPGVGHLPSLTDECLQRSCSFGLMQVLGDTARWCGKVKHPYLTVLHDPDVGIDVGCRVLSFYLGRANGNYELALKKYNGSSAYPPKIFARLERNEHLAFFE